MRRGAAATAVGKNAARWSRRGGSCGREATRKQIFHTILPLLSAGLIRSAKGKRPARKDERRIREAVRAMRAEQQEAGEEADTYVAMTNLIEQACNCYLETEAFPATCEELYAIPVRAARPAALGWG